MSYILYMSLLINLGYFDGSFTGTSTKHFETQQQCLDAAKTIQAKVESKIGSALKRIDFDCIKTKTKPTT